jgi:hypothetical protein
MEKSPSTILVLTKHGIFIAEYYIENNQEIN